MRRYTLKTYYGQKLLECFTHRSVTKVQEILKQEKHNQPGKEDAWGRSLGTADRFELYNNMQERIFSGNIVEIKAFISTIR